MGCRKHNSDRHFWPLLATHPLAAHNMLLPGSMVSTSARLTVEWLVAIGEARSITAALHALLVSVRGEHGCTGCSLSTDVGAKVALRFVESWANEDDFQRHLRSDLFASLAGLVESATEPPLVEISLPAGIHGLEYVDAVRQSHERSLRP